jgi:NTP pyrophosphatase (non-canonical NTP hydrolase)
MDMKNIVEYQAAARRTRVDLESPGADTMHMLLGMVSEVGELINVYKASLAYGKEVDMVNVKEEIGDLFWFIVNFCDINSLDLEDILARNVAKLLVRYPQKFTNFLALDRDLKKERDTLEKE